MSPRASVSRALRGPAWRWLLLVVLVSCMVQGASAQTPAIDGGFNVAGLVIDYGDDRMSYAVVPFTEESISGIELLRRSGLTLVTIPFGGLGEGVCSIESTGCDVGDCRTRMCQSADRESPFWQYVRQGDGGSWAPAAVGATRARVEDGDIDAWVWTGATPELPQISIASLRERLEVPSTWSTTAAELPESIVLTEGNAPVEDDTTTWREVIPGLAVIAGVGVVGWVLQRLSRRLTPYQ